MDFIQKYLFAVWEMVLEMAPYLLLGFAIAGLLHKFISQAWIEKRLGKRTLGSVILASLVGVPMPLCSCGVVPVAASIRNKGASKGATASFLTSTPQTGVDSIIATYGMLGPVFAVYRVVVAFISGIIVGLVVESLDKSKAPETTPKKTISDPAPNWKESFTYAFATLPQSIGTSLIIGFLLAGLIAAAAPEDLLSSLPGGIFSSIILTTIIAVPLYVCSTGSIPLAIALIGSGLPISAALVLLIAGPATNAATVATMKKVLGGKETIAYLGSIILSSWIAAYIFHLFFGEKAMETAAIHHHTEYGIGSFMGAIILLAMIAWPYIPKPSTKKATFSDSSMSENITLKVDGMSCNHCKATVIKGLDSLLETTQVDVDLAKGLVSVHGQNLNQDTLAEKIVAMGFEIRD